jgi:hypothetical protein
LKRNRHIFHVAQVLAALKSPVADDAAAIDRSING